MFRSFFAAALLVGALGAPALAASAPAAIIPAHTVVRFSLTAPVASNTSVSGTPFTFVLIDPIVVNDVLLVAAGTVGYGTLILAGHAGTSGHEGDITLRLDSIPTIDGRMIAFNDQRLRINGRNRKIMSGVLGFIPYAGFGARFIRGADVRIEATTPIMTVLSHDASTSVPTPVAVASPPALEATPQP